MERFMTVKSFENTEVRRKLKDLPMTEAERASAMHTLRIAEAFASVVVGARDAMSRLLG
jgi:hypothetical protein